MGHRQAYPQNAAGFCDARTKVASPGLVAILGDNGSSKKGFADKPMKARA
jgi:hypothetical protein